MNYYSGWEQRFNTSLAESAYADGIETFVEMEPWNCGNNCQGNAVRAMTDIAVGAYDSYLISFGQAIRGIRASDARDVRARNERRLGPMGLRRERAHHARAMDRGVGSRRHRDQCAGTGPSPSLSASTAAGLIADPPSIY